MNPQEFLPWISAALQWARAQKKFAEIWYLAVVAGMSMAFYALSRPADAFAQPWNLILAGWWEQAKIILAMTQVVSSSSNVVNSIRGDGAKPSVILPVTNSQG